MKLVLVAALAFLPVSAFAEDSEPPAKEKEKEKEEDKPKAQPKPKPKKRKYNGPYSSPPSYPGQGWVKKR